MSGSHRGEKILMGGFLLSREGSHSANDSAGFLGQGPTPQHSSRSLDFAPSQMGCTMGDVGGVLCKARKSLGLSLDELQQKTGIERLFLQAIEQGEMGNLPSPFYTRNFLRNYAKCVQLEPHRILRRYRRYEQAEREITGKWQRMELSPTGTGHATMGRVVCSQSTTRHRTAVGSEGGSDPWTPPTQHVLSQQRPSRGTSSSTDPLGRGRAPSPSRPAQQTRLRRVDRYRQEMQERQSRGWLVAAVFSSLLAIGLLTAAVWNFL
ncbi:helix-turn-helix domain-containing protein [Pasteuria penetrans]|uniref:helix-turn-helix domain-containing protein n=1 Tax=Pasteuria penetrans TaxID=86005 RepID=UPI000F9F3484|nr:helix-turn-helix domain-containing protein [Pasteuria penetrans]